MKNNTLEKIINNRFTRSILISGITLTIFYPIYESYYESYNSNRINRQLLKETIRKNALYEKKRKEDREKLLEFGHNATQMIYSQY